MFQNNFRKRIGCILAVRRRNHNNYGTTLQSFATVKVLQDAGYQVRIIRYNKQRNLLQTIAALPNYIRSGGSGELIIRLNKKIISFLRPSYRKNSQIRNNAVEQNFKELFFEPLCDYYNGYEELKEGTKNYGLFLVGSDQLWHPMGLASGFYNLMFVPDGKMKLAYAASFGLSYIPDFQKERTKKYLERFSWISCREQQGIRIIQDLSDVVHPDFVCDPAMLLSKEEWKNFAKDATCHLEKPYIFCYFLGERKDIRQYAVELKERTGLPIVCLPHVDKFVRADDGFGDTPLYRVTPMDFVALLNEAEFVLTDSFHGTLFSIILEKNFITFYRTKPSSVISTHSRIDSLLEKFGLQKQLFDKDIFKQINERIDFSKVSVVVEDFRRKSRNLLLQHIEAV